MVDDHSACAAADAAPPESLSELLGEHTALALAAGFGLGLLAGAALPGNAGKSTVRRAVALAAGAAELALPISGRQNDEAAAAAPKSPNPLGSALSVAGNALRLAVNARG